MSNPKSSPKLSRVSMPPRASMPPTGLILTAGKFYESRAGEVWCCFKVEPAEQVHCQARCIRVEDERVEYFYIDGRYDAAGKREHTLIKLAR